MKPSTETGWTPQLQGWLTQLAPHPLCSAGGHQSRVVTKHPVPKCLTRACCSRWAPLRSRGQQDSPHLTAEPSSCSGAHPYSFTDSSPESGHLYWQVCPWGARSPRRVPPSSTDSETSGGCLQGGARVCHRAGFWQATVHELTVAFDVSSSNNLRGFV